MDKVLGRVLVHAAADFLVHASYTSGGLKKAFALRVLANSLKQKDVLLAGSFSWSNIVVPIYIEALWAHGLKTKYKLTNSERNSLAFEILPEPLGELSPRCFHHQIRMRSRLLPEGKLRDRLITPDRTYDSDIRKSQAQRSTLLLLSIRQIRKRLR